MDRSIRTALAVAAASLALLAAGCGEGGKESAHRGMSVDEAARQAFGVNEDGVGYVGSENCVGCHQDPTCKTCHPTMDLKTVVVDKYLESGHVIHSGTVDASAGNAGCRSTCHDPVGDGRDLEAFLPPDDVPALGLAAVTCEACHGAGGRHFGAGPMTDPRPTFEVCGGCHNGTMTAMHEVLRPNGLQIAEKYADSKHAASMERPTLVGGTTSDVRPLCSKCHSDEGAKAYIDVNGGRAALVAAFPNDPASPDYKPPMEDATPVQCRTCHDAHDPSRLLLADETDPVTNAVVASGQYRTCTNCHQLADAYHGELNGRSWSEGAPDYPVGVGTFNPNEIMYDTHFDDPLTDTIEGYVVDVKGSAPCVGCHNPHEATIDLEAEGDVAPPSIHQQWAASAHGGHLLVKKAAAAQAEGTGEADVAAILAGIQAAGVTKTDGPAWVNYDFKAANRQACQRCHTTTGFVNFAADPARYDPARNVFAGTGKQRELLYCYGCHSSNTGQLRNPGPYDADYDYTSGSTLVADVVYAYPDAEGSNVCMSCHSGRQSGTTIARLQSNNGVTIDFANLGFVNPHYLAAGGVLYGGIGYEYDADGDPATDDYANVAKFKHDIIGIEGAVAGVDTGSGGPCAGCHMDAEESHSFEPVEKDATTGEVTAVTAEVCDQCHTPAFDGVMTPDVLNAEKHDFEAALAALEVQLTAAGFHFYPQHPYFFSEPYVEGYVPPTGACGTSNLAVMNWQSGGTTTWTWNGTKCVSSVGTAGTPDTGKPNMGAALNFALLHHELGAYAHNRYYTRRLIYDSIDWLDNGLMDDTVLQTVTDEAAKRYLRDIGRQ